MSEEESRRAEAGGSGVPWEDSRLEIELRDDADDFEDALIMEMSQAGIIEVW